MATSPRLTELLARTSRTFALTIPLLDEPLRAQVGTAYLLFRIADTLEDAERAGRDVRLDLLARFERLLERTSPPPEEVEAFVEVCEERGPTSNEDYAALLAETGAVFDALGTCDAGAADAIRRHLRGTTQRMADFVARADERGSLALDDLADLRAYCYAVAGIVGEMLTDLIVRAEPGLSGARADLERDAKEFGEALQLVNILKDAGADLVEGRTYLPAGVDRDAVFRLAAEDLVRARRYVETLHRNGASRGTLAFHALPIRLAEATLDAVRAHGPGAKISRDAVAMIVGAMHASLDRGGSGL